MPEALRPPTDVPAVRLEHVTVVLDGQVILEDVTFAVPQGAFWAIVGPNAAGKTTLLRTILGLIRPRSGRVEVFGRPPQALTAWRSRIGYVPQQHTMARRFPLRAYDVVMMGRMGGAWSFLRRPSEEDHAAVRKALERVEMLPAAQKSWHALSGGERQRVLLARALACDPWLLLLDEPTAGVDVAATRSLYHLLQDLNRHGLTILMVSHDIGVVAEVVHGVACLNRRLVAHGRPEEVLTLENLDTMYGCEAVVLYHGAVPHLVVRRHGGPSAS